MPIYEFVCEDCRGNVDVRASLAEKDAGLAPSCPTCGSPRMRQLLSTFAVGTSGSSSAATTPATSGAGGGGCCGGGCCN